MGYLKPKFDSLEMSDYKRVEERERERERERES